MSKRLLHARVVIFHYCDGLYHLHSHFPAACGLSSRWALWVQKPETGGIEVSWSRQIYGAFSHLGHHKAALGFIAQWAEPALLAEAVRNCSVRSDFFTSRMILSPSSSPMAVGFTPPPGCFCAIQMVHGEGQVQRQSPALDLWLGISCVSGCGSWAYWLHVCRGKFKAVNLMLFILLLVLQTKKPQGGRGTNLTAKVVSPDRNIMQ